jgi:hypothetical protein
MNDDDVPDCPGVMMHTAYGRALDEQRRAMSNNPAAVGAYLARRREQVDVTHVKDLDCIVRKATTMYGLVESLWVRDKLTIPHTRLDNGNFYFTSEAALLNLIREQK